MAHYAQINEDNVVVDIMKISDEYEDYGEDFINNVCMIPGRWIKTSYNTFGNKHKYGGAPFRGNYAIIGGTYDPIRDVFLPKKLYPSMVLNEETFLWEYAVPFPDIIVLPPQKLLTDIPGRIIMKEDRFEWNEDIVNWELKHYEKIVDIPLD
jgi:hypothetical protein